VNSGAAEVGTPAAPPEPQLPWQQAQVSIESTIKKRGRPKKVTSAQEPSEPGNLGFSPDMEIYLTSLRAQAREAAADLYYMTQLRKGAPEPPREPNVDADRALALLLARPTAYPDLPHLNAKTLEELDE